MMKTIISILMTASFMLSSCSQEKKTPEELVNETPTAIEEKSSYDISSYKDRGWKENIIERLYNEAVEKNKMVSNIDSFIVSANQLHVDSLIDFKKYSSINEEYWKTANNYIARITDTVVRSTVKELFDKAEFNYCDAKKGLIHLADKIELEKEHFDNQVLLLKLAVTLPMIQNYQNNEKPDSSKLKSILTGFDNATKEIKDFVK